MTDKIKLLMELAEELYHEEQKKSGMITPLPYAFIEGKGKFLIFCNWPKDSKEVSKLLNEKYGHSHG